MTPLRTISILIGTLSAASAAGIIPRVVLSSGRLDRRQNEGIPNPPTQCKTTCDPISGIIQAQVQAKCTPPVCCSSLFEQGYFNCLKCIADADHITNYTEPQQLVDNLTVICFNAGLPIKELTYPGQNPNRTLATSSRPSASHPASSTSTSHISQITISTLPTSAPAPTVTQQTVSQTVSEPLPSGPGSNAAIQHSADASVGLLALVAFVFMLT